MSDMVEKVARAIWALQRDTDCNDYDKLWDGPCSAKEIARDMARAAIEAMREPTEDMLEAGTNAVDDGETYSCRAKAEGVYYGMLSAALSPKGE